MMYSSNLSRPRSRSIRKPGTDIVRASSQEILRDKAGAVIYLKEDLVAAFSAARSRLR